MATGSSAGERIIAGRRGVARVRAGGMSPQQARESTAGHDSGGDLMLSPNPHYSVLQTYQNRPSPGQALALHLAEHRIAFLAVVLKGTSLNFLWDSHWKPAGTRRRVARRTRTRYWVFTIVCRKAPTSLSRQAWGSCSGSGSSQKPARRRLGVGRCQKRTSPPRSIRSNCFSTWVAR